MRGQPGFWDIDERYVRLSEAGDPLEKLDALVPWEVFRKPLAKALERSYGAKGGRPPLRPGADVQDPGAPGALQPLRRPDGVHDPGPAVFMRVLGLGLSDRVPDAKTIWLFREHLARAGAVENLFARLDKHL